MVVDTNKDMILRLRRIEGQVRGVQRMIEQEADCGEVLNQITAIKSAVNQVGILVFEHYARDCISRSINEPDGEDYFNEIMTLMSRFVK
ncbi:MAG TPA: metal-sensitive transcriptional regulator [Syntrophomonadaceae bacterium]|jgi:DNA-binding FrmR family transcriptional regulator|nr:metal-sensitive transcriptional regulator [Syntrophomonadaceae bacterium]